MVRCTNKSAKDKGSLTVAPDLPQELTQENRTQSHTHTHTKPSIIPLTVNVMSYTTTVVQTADLRATSQV